MWVAQAAGYQHSSAISQQNAELSKSLHCITETYYMFNSDPNQFCKRQTSVLRLYFKTSFKITRHSRISCKCNNQEYTYLLTINMDDITVTDVDEYGNFETETPVIETFSMFDIFSYIGK